MTVKTRQNYLFIYFFMGLCNYDELSQVSISFLERTERVTLTNNCLKKRHVNQWPVAA